MCTAAHTWHTSASDEHTLRGITTVMTLPELQSFGPLLFLAGWRSAATFLILCVRVHTLEICCVHPFTCVTKN